MANKNNVPVKSDETTGSGGTTTTVKKTMYILGHSDTQIGPGVFDEKGQELLAKVSLRDMGNEERKARKGKKRVVYDKFGRESTEKAVKERNSEKSPQLTLGNVLGLSNLPKPGPGAGGPRPR